jgi:glycyl-tRNA synthetase beta chain
MQALADVPKTRPVSSSVTSAYAAREEVSTSFTSTYAVLADSHRRIQNITRGLPAATILPADLLLTDPEELVLRQSAESAAPRILEFLAVRKYADAIRTCEELAVPITAFFDRVLVMATDERVRSARLLLLCYLKYILGLVCDYSKLT